MKNKKLKLTTSQIQEIFDYIENTWGENDGVPEGYMSEIEAMCDWGDVGYICDYIVGAGAVENHCENLDVEKNILAIAGGYTLAKGKRSAKRFCAYYEHTENDFGTFWRKREDV